MLAVGIEELMADERIRRGSAVWPGVSHDLWFGEGFVEEKVAPAQVEIGALPALASR